MAKLSDTYILAIESAISGGSISLSTRGEIIAESVGGTSVSRAEDLLPNIETLLHESGVGRHEIRRIAISLGPGSYTGLRIGIATVLGLCRGLGIPHVGIPLINAIANFFPKDHTLLALPMGRSDICLADISSATTKVLSMDDLKRDVEQRPNSHLLIHSDLLPDLIDVQPNLNDIGKNLARYVAAAAGDQQPSPTLDPIYIQNPRFGNAVPS